MGSVVYYIQETLQKLCYWNYHRIKYQHWSSPVQWMVILCLLQHIFHMILCAACLGLGEKKDISCLTFFIWS